MESRDHTLFRGLLLTRSELLESTPGIRDVLRVLRPSRKEGCD